MSVGARGVQFVHAAHHGAPMVGTIWHACSLAGRLPLRLIPGLLPAFLAPCFCFCGLLSPRPTASLALWVSGYLAGCVAAWLPGCLDAWLAA